MSVSSLHHLTAACLFLHFLWDSWIDKRFVFDFTSYKASRLKRGKEWVLLFFGCCFCNSHSWHLETTLYCILPHVAHFWKLSGTKRMDSKTILEAYYVLAFNCDKASENKDLSCPQTSVPVDQNYILMGRGWVFSLWRGAGKASNACSHAWMCMSHPVKGKKCVIFESEAGTLEEKHDMT